MDDIITTLYNGWFNFKYYVLSWQSLRSEVRLTVMFIAFFMGVMFEVFAELQGKTSARSQVHIKRKSRRNIDAIFFLISNSLYQCLSKTCLCEKWEKSWRQNVPITWCKLSHSRARTLWQKDKMRGEGQLITNLFKQRKKDK